MSLIIAYIGKKGCVMAADKRKIGYFGDKKNLKIEDIQNKRKRFESKRKYHTRSGCHNSYAIL